MAYILDENGNYKRTCRCSECYEVGHTRRTCPEIYPDGTPAQKQKERKEANAEKRRKARAAGIKVDRKCTYCGETGHQRRKCSTLKKDSKKMVKAALEYRKYIRENLEEMGAGVGALLKVTREENRWNERKETHEYTPVSDYLMVTKIALDKMLPWGNWYVGKRYDSTDPRHNQHNNATTLMYISANYRHADLFDTYQNPLIVSSTVDENHLDRNRQRYWNLTDNQEGWGNTGHKTKVIHRTKPEMPANWENRKSLKGIVDKYILKSTKPREFFRWIHYNIDNQ